MFSLHPGAGRQQTLGMARLCLYPQATSQSEALTESRSILQAAGELSFRLQD